MNTLKEVISALKFNNKSSLFVLKLTLVGDTATQLLCMVNRGTVREDFYDAVHVREEAVDRLFRE